jgi:hypothetical protein
MVFLSFFYHFVFHVFVQACFGIPAGCVATGKCEVVASYWPDK